MDNENVNETMTEGVAEFDPLAEIQALKQNTVSKEQYDKLQNNYAKAIRALANGERTETEQKKEPVNLNELRKEIFKGENNNLEYAKKVLLLRNELIERGERDPFLPVGKFVPVTDECVNEADKVADVLQQCIDISDGDNTMFTAALQRRLVDTAIPKKNNKNRGY